MIRHALLLTCISCMAIQLVHAQRTITDSPRITVRHPESANAEQDCSRAIAHRDFRFVGVAGYALDVPGVPDYQTRYWKTNGVKVMTGTSDVGDLTFNEPARKYARRYNARLLKYLLTHRISNVKT
jgi:hypothetical protein